jgi:hypothetical protein
MRSLVTAALFLVAALSVPACSSSSSSAAAQCNAQPYTCAAGTTCWPTDQAANFSCLKSGPGKAGDACVNTVASATCGDGLMCFQQTSTSGACVPYCDSSHPCPNAQACSTANILGTSALVHICLSGLPQADAGTDSGPAADASTD